MKKRKLKDLNIKYISMVMGENRSPMNPGAKTLFIKSTKEEKSMESKFLEFLTGIFQKGSKAEEVKAQEAPPPAETKEMEKTVAYVTKADFEQFETKIAEVIKAGLIQKSQDEATLFTEFAKGLHDAYQSDMEALKKSLVAEKREATPVLQQPNLTDLIRNFSKKEVTASNAQETVANGQIVNTFVKDRIDRGIIKQDTLPGIKSDFDLVVDELTGI